MPRKLGLRERLWIRQSFLLPEDKITDADMRRRLSTSASFKYTDTTLGGNFVINAPPSYCRFADPRMGGSIDAGRGMAWMRSTGRFRSTSNDASMLEDEIDIDGGQLTSPSMGMGAHYSEAIDDNSQVVIMRFGVPAFNTLTTFFGQFYHPEAAQFASSGRTSDTIIGGMLNKIGAAVGGMTGFMLALPFQPLILLGSFWRKFTGAPPSKFYYLKPSMFAYWSAVQTIVNGIGVNLGIVPQQLTEAQSSVTGGGVSQFGPANFSQYSAMLPDIISPDGYIDVYAMATKAQRRANKFQSNLMKRLESVTDMRTLAEAFRATQAEMSTDAGINTGHKTFTGYVNAYKANSYYKQGGGGATVGTGGDGGGDTVTDGGGDTATSAEHTPTADEMEPIGAREAFNSDSSAWALWMGEMRDGSNFISWKVDYTGTHNESFNNETGESGIAQKFNSTSASARSARFDFADGNIGFGLGEVLNAGKSLVNGLLDQVQLSGLAAMFGSAFVDIPHVWQNSAAQLPSANFTIELRSPYANRLSQMQNLYIPLAMLLAGALPLATGKKSYTSPFICELYCKGRVNIRLGIIDSLSIERGVGNVGWNRDGYALGINVNFSVKDLSTIMAVPVTTQFSTTEKLVNAAAEGIEALGVPGVDTAVAALTKSMYDDDNTFTDYLATIGGLSFQDMIYSGRQWRINRLKLHREVQGMTSPARWASMLGGMLPGRVWNAIALETDRSGTAGL